MSNKTVAGLRMYADDLGFRPEDAVRWLSPVELLRAGVKVVLSSLFASYADKREVQQALLAEALSVRPADSERTVAGLRRRHRRGFDATYTVAGCSRPTSSTRNPPTDRGGPLPRASVLVMGGDEVYPTASAREYDNRMKGPYRAALPAAWTPRRLFVLPGNHDWYDGLPRSCGCSPRNGRSGRGAPSRPAATSRSRCRTGGGSSGWTPSSAASSTPRSCATSTHFLSDNLLPGDSVILCAATPTWVHSAAGERPRRVQLAALVRPPIHPHAPRRVRPARPDRRLGPVVDHRRRAPLRAVRRALARGGRVARHPRPSGRRPSPCSRPTRSAARW